ncbi:MAG TPA: flagellar protein FlaG [Syntrophales bacterium]|nr:flagellar protein FlaG [Syntrophales bacterium]
MDVTVSNINALAIASPAIPSAAGSTAGTGAPMEPSQQDVPQSSEATNQAIQKIQSQMESMNIGLSFSTYGKKGEDISVIVTDKDTGKVIREIPPKDMQDLQTKIEEMIGLLFNNSV